MSTYNPFDVTKQMFAEFEKNLGEYLQKTMREPAFMQLVARNMEGSLDLRGLVKAQFERAVKSLDLPTSTSMAGLYQTVHNLETRLLDLEEKVDEIGETLALALSRMTPSAPAPAPAFAKVAEKPAAAKPVAAASRKPAPKASVPAKAAPAKKCAPRSVKKGGRK